MINQITAIQENIFPKLLHKNSLRNGTPLKESGDSCSRNLPPYDSKLYTKPFQMNLLHLEISHSESWTGFGGQNTDCESHSLPTNLYLEFTASQPLDLIS